jgi:hypothetical protein
MASKYQTYKCRHCASAFKGMLAPFLGVIRDVILSVVQELGTRSVCSVHSRMFKNFDGPE